MNVPQLQREQGFVSAWVCDSLPSQIAQEYERVRYKTLKQ